MKRVFFHLVGLFAFTTCLAMDLRLPTPAESLRAIGSTKDLPKTVQRALDPDGDFEHIPVPRPGDWLAEHPEPGQPFEDFVKSRPNRPEGQRNKIYLQPLGEFPEDRSPSVETLKEYTANYFVMDVEVLPSLSVRCRYRAFQIVTITELCLKKSS